MLGPGPGAAVGANQRGQAAVMRILGGPGLSGWDDSLRVARRRNLSGAPVGANNRGQAAVMRILGDPGHAYEPFPGRAPRLRLVHRNGRRARDSWRWKGSTLLPKFCDRSG